jgi:hypothetical protein
MATASCRLGVPQQAALGCRLGKRDFRFSSTQRIHLHAQHRTSPCPNRDPVCLLSSCARSANDVHGRRSSRVPTSVDRATHDSRFVHPQSRHNDCNEPARNVLPRCWSWFLSYRDLAKDSAGSAERRPRTERGKIKGARSAPVGDGRRQDSSGSRRDVRSSTVACEFRQGIEGATLTAPRARRDAVSHDRPCGGGRLPI